MKRSRTIRLKLTPDEQQQLKRLTRLPSTPAIIYRRARAILLLSEGMRPREVITMADLDRANIFRWTKRYMESGIEALKTAGNVKSRVNKVVAAVRSGSTEDSAPKSFANLMRELAQRNATLASEGLLEPSQVGEP